MGFLDWLFGKEKQEETAENKPREDDLESSKSLVKQKIDDETKSFWPKIEKFHAELKSKNEELKKFTESLKNAKPPEKIDEQVLKIASTSRNTFAAKMSAISSVIERNFSKDIGSFADYHATVASMISQVNKETVKEFTSLNVAFSKETNGVVGKLREINDKVRGFEKELKGGKEKVDPLERLQNDMRTLEEKDSESETAKKSIEKTKTGLGNAESEKLEMEKRLENLGQSEKWNAYIKLTKERETLESEARNVIEEVVNIFASIDRPLKKFAKSVDENSVAFKNKDLLKRYIESPFDGFVQDGGLETIDSALANIEEMIGSGNLSADNKDESLRIIQNLKSSKILHGLSNRYSENSDRMITLKEKIDSHEYLKERKELQDGISKMSRTIEEKKKLLIHDEKSQEGLEKEIGRIRDELKTKLSEL